MKQWISKLIDQFEFEWNNDTPKEKREIHLTEERASLIHIIDAYNKHLLEIDKYPVRKVRKILDEFARELMIPEPKTLDKTLFRIRNFFTRYRVDEYTYIHKTLEEFRAIIWDFVDQISEDLTYEKVEDDEILESLEHVKEAVEANSIEDLKSQSRFFIDSYMAFQNKRENRRSERMQAVTKNLETVKKKLVEANDNMRLDHMTKAFNRKSFDEHMRRHWQLCKISRAPISLIMLDIDHFKKVNDTHGHAVGDFVLIECVKILREMFAGHSDFVARVGGEEFAIILPDHKIEHAITKTEKAMERIRKDVLVSNEGAKIQFTVSMGIAQLMTNENVDHWMKRADSALYEAKNTGRDRYKVAPDILNNDAA